MENILVYFTHVSIPTRGAFNGETMRVHKFADGRTGFASVGELRDVEAWDSAMEDSRTKNIWKRFLIRVSLGARPKVSYIKLNCGDICHISGLTQEIQRRYGTSHWALADFCPIYESGRSQDGFFLRGAASGRYILVKDLPDTAMLTLYSTQEVEKYYELRRSIDSKLAAQS